ncbi:MAG TPA: ComF family protein [Sphingomonas sp.]|nr:ComF family protein [Sphingomonas sp.]
MAPALARSIRALARIGAVPLPPRCPGCAVPVEADHRFCAACWNSLRFIGPPWCAGCNVPFDFERGEAARCASCLAEPPRHAGVRAAVGYGDVARHLALRLKYAGRTGIATTVARQIARVVPADRVDLLVPVPLDRWRLWSRGFNQAALIADALGATAGLPCDRGSLVRSRRTPVLRGLSGAQRARAVRGAFAVIDRGAVSGRAIGLVDDVYTSGATAAACTRALLGAGAASVTILCWARVLPEAADD